MTRQMLRQKLGDKTPIEVVSATGAKADQHAHGFAGVEIRDRVGGGAGRDSQQQRKRDRDLFHHRSASARLRHSAHGRAEAVSIAWLLVIASARVMKLIGPPMVWAASCWRALISV